MQRLILKSFLDIYKMCLSPATLRFGAFALGQHMGITSFKLTVLYTKKIEIFGSYARGEQKETSDLDVIVEFEKRKSLLELVGIEQELYKTKIVGKEEAEREKRR